MTDQDFGAGIDRLFALVPDDLHTRVDPANTAAIVGWGTTFNALHLVRGIRAVHAADCCAAAPPLLRSLLEYTVGTIWLADAGDEAVEVLNRGTLFTHKKLNQVLDALEDMEWRKRLPAEAIRNFESVVATELGPHPDQYLLGFTSLLEEYGFEQWVPIYNVLSMVSHLSKVGAQRYFRQTPEAFDMAQLPIQREAVPCEEFSFGLLVDTMAAYDRLLRGNPWTVGLEKIAADYKFTITNAQRKTTRG